MRKQIYLPIFLFLILGISLVTAIPPIKNYDKLEFKAKGGNLDYLAHNNPNLEDHFTDFKRTNINVNFKADIVETGEEIKRLENPRGEIIIHALTQDNHRLMFFFKFDPSIDGQYLVRQDADLTQFVAEGEARHWSSLYGSYITRHRVGFAYNRTSEEIQDGFAFPDGYHISDVPARLKPKNL